MSRMILTVSLVIGRPDGYEAHHVSSTLVTFAPSHRGVTRGCWHLICPGLLMLVYTLRNRCLFFSKNQYEKKVSARDRLDFSDLIIDDHSSTDAMNDFQDCWNNHVTVRAQRNLTVAYGMRFGVMQDPRMRTEASDCVARYNQSSIETSRRQAAMAHGAEAAAPHQASRACTQPECLLSVHSLQTVHQKCAEGVHTVLNECAQCAQCARWCTSRLILCIFCSVCFLCTLSIHQNNVCTLATYQCNLTEKFHTHLIHFCIHNRIKHFDH
jgi:hypothetical protein